MHSSYKISFVIENTNDDQIALLDTVIALAAELASACGGDFDEETVCVVPAEDESDRADRLHGG